MPAAIVGVHEYKARSLSQPLAATELEQATDLTLRALEDAGLTLADVNGISLCGMWVADMVRPSTLTEYLGITVDFADAIDLGGASSGAMVGRAAIAIEAGLADVVVCVILGSFPQPDAAGAPWSDLGPSSYKDGSPQAEFEIPYAHLGPNASYAMIANRYAAQYSYNASALAKLVAAQRHNACYNPDAIFFNKPVTAEAVLDSRMIASPLRLLEIVRPINGGAAVIVASEEIAKRCRHRPAFVAGYSEAMSHKSAQFARDMLNPPLGRAAARAFKRANLTHADIDAVQIYDCYSIAVLMGLEAAGFAKKGEGMKFLNDHDVTFSGDFPLNTNGGQLGFGQAGFAGGMTHVIEGARQVMGRAAERQVKDCNTAFVSGNGGYMSEQCALILRGE
ncbi:thiolase family protein [Sphingomonas bisphenolicum]